MKVTFMVLLVAASACSSRSEAEIEAEFEAFVEKSNHCASADECTLVSAGCPLGCWVAVNETRVSAVKDKARDLIDEYESGGRGCDYGCIAAEAPTCDEGHCRAEPFFGGPDAGEPAPIQ